MAPLFNTISITTLVNCAELIQEQWCAMGSIRMVSYLVGLWCMWFKLTSKEVEVKVLIHRLQRRLLIQPLILDGTRSGLCYRSNNLFSLDLLCSNTFIYLKFTATFIWTSRTGLHERKNEFINIWCMNSKSNSMLLRRSS